MSTRVVTCGLLGLASLGLGLGIRLPTALAQGAMHTSRCILMPSACGLSGNQSSPFTVNQPTAVCPPLASRPEVTLTWSAAAAVSEYTVVQNGVVIRSVPATQPRSLTLQANNSSSYTYSVSAQLQSGGSVTATPSNTDPLTTPDCLNQAGTTLSATIQPATASVRPGGTQLFTAVVTVNGQTVSASSGQLAITWAVVDRPEAGSILRDSGNQTRATFTAGSVLDTFTNVIVARVTYTTAGPDSVTLPEFETRASVTIRDSIIRGDVYSGGSVSDISVDPGSVVSATGTISGVGSNNTIPGYTRDVVEETSSLLERLVKEKAVSLPIGGSNTITLSGPFNLNPKSRTNPTDTADNTANPDGGVWYVPGNLLLRGVTFTGRGTIIVDGSVTVDAMSGGAGTQYSGATSLLGVVARGSVARSQAGDITIAPGQTLVGAFYAPAGTVRIGKNVTVPQGLFVGKSVVLGSENIFLTYDGRITKRPPLGFSQSFTPNVTEVTP
ncbi:hypothetical protein HY524_00040 [Candidatus Berkelbacteria bacterium]|nr:hypothetical protein [Candidatus Berkelbacteria bacterium]